MFFFNREKSADVLSAQEFLDSIDQCVLEKNIFVIAGDIKKGDGAASLMKRLPQDFETQVQALDKEQKNKISRFFSVYAWASKLAGEQQLDALSGFLAVAKSLEQDDKTRGLRVYIEATLLRGFGKFEEAVEPAENALVCFGDDQFLKGHANCSLGLLHIRLGQLEDAKDFLEKVQTEESLICTEVSQIIYNAEGDVADRTYTNLAQCYEKLGEFEKALNVAQCGMEHKISHDRSAEEVAYAQIVVGEIHNKLGNLDEAHRETFQAYQTYKERHETGVVPNYLRATIAHAEVLSNQGEEAAGEFIGLAKHMAEELHLSEEHDFSLRIRAINSQLSPSTPR